MKTVAIGIGTRCYKNSDEVSHGRETVPELNERNLDKEEQEDLEWQKQKHRGRKQSRVSTTVNNRCNIYTATSRR